MRRVIGFVLLFAVGACAALDGRSRLLAESPTADDFLPINKNGAAEVGAPGAVRVDESSNTVSAKTGQDAVNAARDRNLKKFSGSGACFTDFPSGLGIVATGKANYSLVTNPTLSRINQRQAVLEAFMGAKKELAAFVDGVGNEALDQIQKNVTTLNDANSTKTLANKNRESFSTLKQFVSRMLRSFVVYEIKDEQDANGSGTVYVTIAISPKTLLQLDRVAGGYVAEGSLTDGINRVIDDVQGGVVAPIGARLIEVPETGEVGFVGFGAAVVNDNDDPELRKDLLDRAYTLSEMYALDSLCGLLHGDLVVYQGGVVEKHQGAIQQYSKTLADDPVNNGAEESVVALDKAVKTVINELITREVLESSRKGNVPPGVVKKSWVDEDNEWAYSIAVYVPSATAKAEGIGKAMDASRLLRSDRKRQEGSTQGGSVRPSGVDENQQEPFQKVKPLPGGKVGGGL